jgi:4-hydroxy-tetrahydrodipicolinate synthase
MDNQRQMLRSGLAGISGILVTPFDSDDNIAPAALGPVVDRAIAAGVHILVANGNTSEFYTLTISEAERMIHASAELIGGRVPLVAGIGRGVHDAQALARSAGAAGASAVVLHQPPDPFSAPRGVVTYVERIAEACDGLPILLYLRDDTIGLDAIEALCRLPAVIGVKWASPTPLRLADAMHRAPPEIVWICGLAETWAPPLYAVGARGFTSGLINVWPEQSVAIHKALDAGDYRRAGELIAAVANFEKLRSEEFGGTNVSVIKAALQMIGRDCGHVRSPGAWPLTDRQREALCREINGWERFAALE